MYILYVNVILLLISRVSRSAPAQSVDLDPENPAAKDRATIILQALDEQTSHSPRFLNKVLSMHKEGSNFMTKMELCDSNGCGGDDREKKDCDDDNNEKDDCGDESSEDDDSDETNDPCEYIKGDFKRRAHSAKKPKRHIRREVCDVVCAFDQHSKPYITKHHCEPLEN